jgi:hypothetical protein
MERWRNESICDVINFVLGAFLFVSPWVFSFAAGVETQNAIICGVVIMALSLAALAAFAEWEEWINLIVGLWAFVSPWALGFAGTTAMMVMVIVGLVVAAIAAVELYLLHRAPPHVTAGH